MFMPSFLSDLGTVAKGGNAFDRYASKFEPKKKAATDINTLFTQAQDFINGFGQGTVLKKRSLI